MNIPNLKSSLSILALLAFSANAEVYTTVVKDPTYSLYSGGTLVSTGFTTEDSCISSVATPGEYACITGAVVKAVPVPTPALGYTTERIKLTTEVAPSASIGAFRTVCEFSHFAKNDPIVFPNQPGKSHLHVFFGNTGVDANTTTESLTTTGNSTCRGGIANRSGYWVPAMLDASGNILKPEGILVYYKQGYKIKPSTAIQTPPVGLRMVADQGYFECMRPQVGPRTQTIASCTGGQLWQTVLFPQCWNGVDLDSPNHRSHMAYPVRNPLGGYMCPASHPVAIPEISFVVSYNVLTTTQNWKLTADTNHGDWWNGWRPDILQTWNTNCVQASKDCHAHLLGDGRMMY